MYKILYLTGIPAPYRIDLFNEMGKESNLTVCFLSATQQDRNVQWQSQKAKNFRSVIFNNTPLNNKKIDFSMLKYVYFCHAQYEVIVFHGYASLAAIFSICFMRLKRLNYGIEVDGGIIPSKENYFKKLLKKFLIKGARFWLSSSKETTDFLVYYGANPAHIYEYPFTSLFTRDILLKVPDVVQKKSLRRELKITENQVVISVGQFIHRKGYDVLLKAAKNLPKDIGVYIIGDNPPAEYLTLQKDLNLTHVHFVGFQSKEELKKWYQAADLFVLPTREDIWGLVINEAMAQGLPIITTDKCIAGLKLVKDGENGYIIPTEDVEALCHAISRTFAQDYRIMGQRSLDTIQCYSLEISASRHLDILKHKIKK